MKNRILFVGPDLNEVGGVSFYCKAIVENYPGEIEYFSFPIAMRGKPWVLISVLWRFVGKLLSRRDQIVQLNTSLNLNAITRDALFLMLSLMCSRKTVVFIHGWDVPFESSLQGFRLWLFKSLFNRAVSILVLGTEFKMKLLELGFTNKVVVETTCFSTELKEVAGSISNDTKLAEPHILFISRIVKEKGIFDLVDACLGLLKTYPKLQLDVAGDGPDLILLKEFVNKKKADFVKFHGSVTGQAKVSLFEGAVLFCLPTYYGEGLPVTILEAMRFGLPIVTTKIGGIVDVFVDGENGVYIEPQDVMDLTEKIQALLLNPAILKKISSTNVERSQAFSPENVSQRLAYLHESI